MRGFVDYKWISERMSSEKYELREGYENTDTITNCLMVSGGISEAELVYVLLT